MNTVYIVGAGASVDASFPTGQKLKSIISNDLAFELSKPFNEYSGGGNRLILDALTNCKKSSTATKNIKEAAKISRGVASAASIDNYIDIHRDNQDIAKISKIAIVKVISEMEKKSVLFANNNNPLNTHNVANTWYNDLIISITTGCDFEQLYDRFKEITFIIFNYDRCVEQALLQVLMVLYEREEEEVADLLKQLTFIHPYGSLSNFPGEVGERIHYFGNEVMSDTLLQLSRNIKTFTESIDDNNEDLLKLRGKMMEADRLVFLGFAFHPINMGLLSFKAPDKKEPKRKFKRAVKIYATTFGMSDSDVRIVEKGLNSIYRGRRAFGSNPNIEFNHINKECSDLYREFNLSLGYE